MSEIIEVMTPQQVAEYLQVHVKTVYDLIKAGELKASKLGPRSLRIRKEDIDSFLEYKIISEDELAIQNSGTATERAAQNSGKIDTKEVKEKKAKVKA
jgi:excisionase family DNA binding protein